MCCRLALSIPLRSLLFRCGCAFSLSSSRLAGLGPQTEGRAQGTEEPRDGTWGKCNDKTVWVVPYDGPSSHELWGSTSWPSSAQNAPKKNERGLSSKKAVFIKIQTKVINFRAEEPQRILEENWEEVISPSTLTSRAFGEGLEFSSGLFQVPVGSAQTSCKILFITPRAAPCSSVQSLGATYPSLAWKPRATCSISKLLPSKHAH